MNRLKCVTITGADDSVDIQEMIDLSNEFPFVEWGILVSRKQEGNYRFPSRPWICKLSAQVPQRIQLSTHMCGAWVRQLLTGTLDWAELPDCIYQSDRLQINTHGEGHVVQDKFLSNLGERRGRHQFIFQWDGVNDFLAHIADVFSFNTAILFDTSGGAGILPQSWPAPHPKFLCGYAGGLGPENVIEQTNEIQNICSQQFWIDMERRVRSDDDSKLDMSKVRSVLKSVAKHIYHVQEAN